MVYQLTDAIDITETAAGEVTIDATALVEGALEAMAVFAGAWATEHGVALGFRVVAGSGRSTGRSLRR